MIKAGKKYLYRGKEIVILGYDYVAKELELIPNIEFISNILTSKELITENREIKYKIRC